MGIPFGVNKYRCKPNIISVFYNSFDFDMLKSLEKGAFNNHVNIILLFIDHPPVLMDISYELNADKNGKFKTNHYPHLLKFFPNDGLYWSC